MVKFDFGKYKKKVEPTIQEEKKIIVQEEIEIPKKLKAKVVLTADRTRNKFQLANQIYKKLINDAKRPKYQQKILIEKYRSTFKDLELYENRE